MNGILFNFGIIIKLVLEYFFIIIQVLQLFLLSLYRFKCWCGGH